jgi:hypothetical protein
MRTRLQRRRGSTTCRRIPEADPSPLGPVGIPPRSAHCRGRGEPGHAQLIPLRPLRHAGPRRRITHRRRRAALARRQALYAGVAPEIAVRLGGGTLGVSGALPALPRPVIADHRHAAASARVLRAVARGAVPVGVACLIVAGALPGVVTGNRAMQRRRVADAAVGTVGAHRARDAHMRREIAARVASLRAVRVPRALHARPARDVAVEGGERTIRIDETAVRGRVGRRRVRRSGGVSLRRNGGAIVRSRGRGVVEHLRVLIGGGRVLGADPAREVDRSIVASEEQTGDCERSDSHGPPAILAASSRAWPDG